MAATDPVVEEVLCWQLEIGDGPMRHALASSATVHVANPATDGRWPRWYELVADLGIGSVLHVLLIARNTVIGVLSLYHDKPNAFSVDDQAIAHIIAQHASIALATARKEPQLAPSSER